MDDAVQDSVSNCGLAEQGVIPLSQKAYWPKSASSTEDILFLVNGLAFARQCTEVARDGSEWSCLMVGAAGCKRR